MRKPGRVVAVGSVVENVTKLSSLLSAGERSGVMMVAGIYTQSCPKKVREKSIT